MLKNGRHIYYTYILTNRKKTVLYTGVTNNMKLRLQQHKNGKNPGSFTSRYRCYFLVYYETYTWIQQAISREKELKSWTRKRKDELISKNNPNWDFLDHHFLDS